MLTLFDSNRYETLTEVLLDNLAKSISTSDPWCFESIIVPSAAATRRLELDIAARFGICAHIQFSYLAHWLWAKIGRVMDLPAANAFMPEQLVWRCYRLLESCTWTDTPRIEGWLHTADETMRYELAQRIAQLFERYLSYRPDWLEAWQNGRSLFPRERAHATQHEDERWQSKLWRQLCTECSVSSQTVPGLYAFLSRAPTLDADTVARAHWPKRLHVFALPAIAPLHLALLRAFTPWIEVHIYTLNPCRQYWGDLISAAQRADLALHGQADHAEVGNTLLAEWGQQTQTHLQQLQALTDTVDTVEISRHTENLAPTWLAALQNAWLDCQPLALPRAFFSEIAQGASAKAVWGSMRAEQVSIALRWRRPRSDPEYTKRRSDTGQAAEKCSRPPVENAATHIEVHRCHSLTRQLEVLHDRLLALFNADDPGTAPLSPSEVLVTVPDLAAAAPLIDAVFGTAEGTRRIPYRVTGLPAVRTHSVAQTICDLLRLPTPRIGWFDVIEGLRNDFVALRYGIDERALATIERWCRAAGALRDETALMRLYLGYALPDGADPIAGVLPVSAVANLEDVKLLGRLARFIDDLDDFARTSALPATASDWQLRLLDALERFLPTQVQETEPVTEVRTVLNRLFKAMRDGAADTLLPATVIRSALIHAFEEPARGGVPTGGVTFCAPACLRGLPYRVVCMLGMDDGVLPSVTRPDEFDLTAALARTGDRKQRHEERNVFFDLILAARERLLIAYTGRHLRDNTPLPPAAVVDELLDHLSEALAGSEAQDTNTNPRTAVAIARQRFVIEHPLHPFAAEYFSARLPKESAQICENGEATLDKPLKNTLEQSGGHLFTYDSDRAEIAAALDTHSARAYAPFFIRPLPPPEQSNGNGSDSVIEFHLFERFWQHPVRALLRDRLGVQLVKTPVVLPELEPFTLDHAGRRALVKRVLPILLSADASDGAAFDTARRIAQASPELPSGALGTAVCAHELQALSELAARIRSAGGLPPPPRLFKLKLTPAWPVTLAPPDGHRIDTQTIIRLEGLLQTAHHGPLVLYRYGPASARDYLNAWLCHLMMCADAPAEGAPQTVWLGQPDGFAFKPVPRAAAHTYLAELVALYCFGQCAPLRFFPASAWALVHKGEAAARRAWNGDANQKGEADDVWGRLAFRSEPLKTVLNPHFSALAHAVFAPLIEYLDLSATPDLKSQPRSH